MTLTLLAAAVVLASGHLATPDAHVRLAQARAWLQGDLQLPAEVGDPSQGNIAVSDEGHRYSVSAPGHSLLLVPAVLGGYVLSPLSAFHSHYDAAFLSSFFGPLAHLGTAWALASLATILGSSRRRAMVGAALFATATFALPHSTDGYEHPFEALFVVLAFALAWQAHRALDPERVGSAVLAGLALGAALLFRYSAALAVPALAIVLWPDSRKLARFALGVAPAILALAAFNLLRFGTPLETGYASAWALASPGPGDNPFGTPLAEGLYGLWASPGKGVLLYSPILLAALAAWPRFLERHPRAASAAGLVIASYSLFYATNWAWHGSAWCWGPRYLIPALPFAMLALPFGPPMARPAKFGFAALILVSITVQVSALSVDYRRYLITLKEHAPEVVESERIFFDWRYSPVVHQFQAIHALVHQDNQNLKSYIPPGPWHGVARPASRQAMLASSVDLNAWDLWWVRMWHLPLTTGARIAGTVIAALAAATVLVGLWRLACARCREPPS